MGFGNAAGSFFSKVINGAIRSDSVKEIQRALSPNSLEVNKAINPGMFGGLARTWNLMRNGVADTKALATLDQAGASSKKGMGFVEALKTAHQNPDGSYNYGRIAGSYITGSAAYRVASGGGLYKDRNGNTDIIGLPFI